MHFSVKTLLLSSLQISLGRNRINKVIIICICQSCLWLTTGVLLEAYKTFPLNVCLPEATRKIFLGEFTSGPLLSLLCYKVTGAWNWYLKMLLCALSCNACKGGRRAAPSLTHSCHYFVKSSTKPQNYIVGRKVTLNKEMVRTLGNCNTRGGSGTGISFQWMRSLCQKKGQLFLISIIQQPLLSRRSWWTLPSNFTRYSILDVIDAGLIIC